LECDYKEKMIKKFYFIVLILVFCTCEKPSDCIESTGEIITQEYEVAAFSRIEVHRGIELIISEGTSYKVVVQTGENLIDNVEVRQDGSILTLKDHTSCNWVRDYGLTKVYITAPNLEEIYSKTDRNISSNGILTFPILKLIAFDSDADNLPGAGTGDFIFEVNNDYMEVQSNNVARFFISGQTNLASFSIYFGDSRIDCSTLIADEVVLFHRGSNDIITHPITKVSGKLLSTGDLILKNNPTINLVERLFQGRIIFDF